MFELRTGLSISRKITALAQISALAMIAASPAMAQNAPAASRQTAAAPEEIIVTARKREESIMKTPVIIQAISQKQIENLHIQSIADLTTVSPGLDIQYGFALAGITVTLRGLGNGSSANFADQDVALNIDGFTSNSGTLFRQGMFDVGQIEVLKGPQALFFGKSTSAGLVAIHSADPGRAWDTKVQVGYEFVADEMDLNGYVSGPLTDELGIRVAGYHNTMKGFLYNPNPAAPTRRLPNTEADGGRLTLKYDNPDVGLRAKFKAAFTHDYSNFYEGELNQGKCHSPGVGGYLTSPYNIYDNCVVDKYTSGNPPYLPYNPNGNFSLGSPDFFTGSPVKDGRNGAGYGFTNTGLAVLNVDYDITKDITLASVTALDFVKARDSGNSPSNATALGLLYLEGQSKTQEFSQELRLTTNWKDRWYNFMIGGLYNTGTRRDQLWLIIPGFTVAYDDLTKLKSENDSVFGQILLTPIEHWELSVGVRYQHVNKHFASLRAYSNIPVPDAGEGVQNVPLSQRQIVENATTPEVTLKYSPTDDITAFVSYKKGYKGPGFNANLVVPDYNAATGVAPFSGEHVKGFEGGIKAQVMDRQLGLSLTGYRFSYSDLQVAFTDVTNSAVIIRNGANARVQGFELGVDYMPSSIPGLTVNAFLNFNDSHYTSFPFAPCYGSEHASAGCIVTPMLAYQDLKGRHLNFAPKLLGTLAASYKWDINDKFMAAIDTRLTYTSSQYTSPELNRLGIEGAYALLDIGLRAGPSDGSWELALLCKDCTNKFYIVNGLDAGAGTAPPGLGANVVEDVGRPRQVLLQLTVHPNQL